MLYFGLLWPLTQAVMNISLLLVLNTDRKDLIVIKNLYWEQSSMTLENLSKSEGLQQVSAVT